MQLDKIDEAFVRSLIPEGATPLALVAVVQWFDPDGTQHWRCYPQCDIATSSALGLLEFAKLDLIARTDTGLPFRYDGPVG